MVIPLRYSFLDVHGHDHFQSLCNPPASRQYGDFNELLEMPFEGEFDAGDCEFPNHFIHAIQILLNYNYQIQTRFRSTQAAHATD
jgi:hypothetical protein